MTPPSFNPLAPPPSGVAIRVFTAHPPSGCVATPPPPIGPVMSQREADSSRLESEPNIDCVVLVLNRALAACRQVVKVSLKPPQQQH